MLALNGLFTSDADLMSAGVLVFTLGMGLFFVRCFPSHMKEDVERAAREQG